MSFRGWLYWLGKMLGHVNAVKKKRVGRRVGRVMAGKATGKLLGRVMAGKATGKLFRKIFG
jgi:hypothetical protein